MSYTIVYSPEAQSDLDKIWDEVYETSKNFEIADQYIEGLRNAIRQKKQYPKTGSLLNYMGESTGIYYVPFKKYTVFYRIRDKKIEVGRVLFSRSDYMKTLFGKSEYTLEDQEE